MKTINENPQSLSVFILDDDKFYLEYVKSIVVNYSSSIQIQTYIDKDEMLHNISQNPDVIILDYNLGIDGSKKITAHEVIDTIEQRRPEQHIVLISGESTMPLLEEYNEYRKLEYIVKNQNVRNDIVALLNRKFFVKD